MQFDRGKLIAGQEFPGYDDLWQKTVSRVLRFLPVWLWLAPGLEDRMDTASATRQVLEASLTVFGEKGIRFTMDDVAKQARMSKKTLYVLFADKEALLSEVVDYCFASIKQAEDAVVRDTSLTTLEKIQKILGVMPTNLQRMDFRNLYLAKIRYPKLYEKVARHLESDWEPTLDLIRKGQEEGVIRSFSIPVFRTILSSGIETFLTTDVLNEAQLSYMDGLSELTRIMVQGILKDPVPANQGKNRKGES